MGFNWEDENDTFRDMPDEVNGEAQDTPYVVNAARMSSKPAPQQEQAFVEPAPRAYLQNQALLEEVDIEEDDSFESVLADANLRIELAGLYRMIMNHNLFEGLEVDERAIDTVTKQIRRFAKERMEIMLGMRQEAPKEAMVSSPFNDLEVVVLKKLASQFSKGATESEAAQSPQPVAKAIAKKEGLTPIGQKTAPKAAAPIKKAAPLASKPQAPLQRQARPVQGPMQESEPLTKPISEMTEDEILARNEEAKARQRGQRARATNAIPQPSYDQEEMLHTQRAMELANPGAVSVIMAAIQNSKKQ